jgi:hypothetical protein
MNKYWLRNNSAEDSCLFYITSRLPLGILFESQRSFLTVASTDGSFLEKHVNWNSHQNLPCTVLQISIQQVNFCFCRRIVHNLFPISFLQGHIRPFGGIWVSRYTNDLWKVKVSKVDRFERIAIICLDSFFYNGLVLWQNVALHNVSVP